MRPYDIIEKKKKGYTLSREETYYVISSFMKDEMRPEQMSALLMAICFNGMSDEETVDLTLAMRDSGDVLDLSGIDGVVVDKHSTGGVGDKTTLVLAPLVAACGVPVAKMSGRGLGHTGGTIDKMECIPGFNTAISTRQLIENVNSIGIALAGQTKNLAPADKRIYALRDTTATVDEPSLIAASIMSKKLASGAEKIVCDVKVGDGAFMQNERDATHLASLMISIGRLCGRDTSAIITGMDEPLGYAIGNSLEVIEALTCLKGKETEDLMEVVYTLGTRMLSLAGAVRDEDEALLLLRKKLKSGAAYEKFLELVAKQGGDVSALEDPHALNHAKAVADFSPEKEGYISKISARQIGHLGMLLGGGRARKEDDIDMDVGIVLNKKTGDYIAADEPAARIYAKNQADINMAKRILNEAIAVSEEKLAKRPVVRELL